jgi:hypothetical protein
VSRNLWSLPACQSQSLTEHGPVVTQGSPLVSGTVDVPLRLELTRPASEAACEVKGPRLGIASVERQFPSYRMVARIEKLNIDGKSPEEAPVQAVPNAQKQTKAPDRASTPQCPDRIGPRRAPGWQNTRCQCNDHHHHDCRTERHRVVWAHLV